MRIGIEAQRIFRRKKYGIDRVTIELIRNLQKIDTKNKYFIFAKPGMNEGVISETANFKIVLLKGSNYFLWEQFYLPKAIKKYKCDLIHCTSSTAPLFSKTLTLLTLHDIIFLEKSVLTMMSENATYYNKFGNFYRRIIAPFIIKRSTKIITVSYFERNQIINYFKKINPDKITTVYNGVNDFFSLKEDTILRNKIKSKYKLPDTFLFFIGNKDQRKNTKNVVKAFSLFIESTKSDITLVILHHTRKNLQKILKEIGKPALIEKIVLIGYVSDTDMRALYALSTIFLYPSKREGFGIPIIEAMASGTPVITSCTSSMPEIAGNSAHIVNPESPEEIARGIYKLFYDHTYRKILIKKGIERSKKFSWALMSEKVLAIYTSLNLRYKIIKKVTTQ